MNPKNWFLGTYTNSTWTDLVPAVSVDTVIKSISVSVGSNTANVGIRVVSGSNTITIVPTSSCTPNTGYAADIAVITLLSGDKLQVQSDVSGVQFAAFGAQ